MSYITDYLDKIADRMEAKGLKKEAAAIDALSDKLDQMEKEGKELPNTKHRPAAIFPHDHPKVKDDKDHFPIPDANHGRNALSRANQYSSVPEWYDGSLEDLKKTVADAVKAKFKDIEVTKDSYKKGA